MDKYNLLCLCYFIKHFFHPTFHIRLPHCCPATGVGEGGWLWQCVLPAWDGSLVGGDCLPGVGGEMTVVLILSSGLLVLSVPFHALPWACFYFVDLQFWSRQVSSPERNGKHFKYRILCMLILSLENDLYLQAFVLNKKNAFHQKKMKLVKKRTQARNISHLGKETDALCSSLLGSVRPGLVLLGVV